MITVVCISDTHSKSLNKNWDIPDGDILIHAGDITAHGNKEDVLWAGRQLLKQPHRFKVFVPGNHDQDSYTFNPRLKWEWMPGTIVLQNEAVNLMGLWIYGSDAVTPVMELTNGAHTQFLEVNPLDEEWKKIPDKTDILITHMPPRGILDVNKKGNHMGSPGLTTEVITRVQPKLHVFGHIHLGHGLYKQDKKSTLFVNASLVDDDHAAVYDPIVVQV